MGRTYSFSDGELAVDFEGSSYLVTGSHPGIRVGDTIAFQNQQFTVLEIEYYSDQDYFIAKVSGAAT